MVQLKLITKSGSSVEHPLNNKDYVIWDLFNFKEFRFFIQMLFMDDKCPWMPAIWWLAELRHFKYRLEAESEVLPFCYGLDGDFAGGETVQINGEWWCIEVGPGRCELSRDQLIETEIFPGIVGSNSRSVAWLDLRGKSEYQVDGRLLKLSRRKHPFKWYDAVPKIEAFLMALDQDEPVQSFSSVK